MIAASLIGYKNSGKTTLGVKIAEELKKRGLRVAVAKHAGHFDEPEGADTARYKQVADAVVGLSAGESFVSWPGERTLASLLPFLQADVLLVEGGKKLGWLPRIVLADADVDADDVAEKLDRGLALAVTSKEQADPAGLAALIVERGFVLPALSCGACGHKGCTELAREIVTGIATVDECVVRAEDSIRITVGGEPLALNPFVARFFRAALTGMLSELKGFGPGPVNITME